MSILKIARMGHPVLRQVARKVDPADIKTPAFQKLVDDMIETMREYDGIGLAAPQVHESVRLALIGIEEGKGEDRSIRVLPVINPEVTPTTKETGEDWEGCLSVPGLRGRVSRPNAITVRALDRRGNKVEFDLEGYPGPRRPARAGSPRRRPVHRPDEVVRDAVLHRGVLEVLDRGLRIVQGTR